jgi:ribonuclease Z
MISGKGCGSAAHARNSSLQPGGRGQDFARIKPKLAVYTHYTRPQRDDIPEVSITEIISRTRAIYSGPLEAGEDLMSISIVDSVTVKRLGH